MNSSIKLYDEDNIDELNFPQTLDGQYAKDFLVPLIKEGTQAYIRNIDTKLYVLKIDDVLLPVSVNDKEYENSYVCSPYTHYIQYAKDELYLIKNKFIRSILRFLLNCLSPIFKMSKVNKTVHINNWFVSTNLYPKLTGEQIKLITQFLKAKFPKHHLIFRSINQRHHSQIYQELDQLSYKLIASRQIYLIDPKEKRLKKSQRKAIRQDVGLIEKKGYQLYTEKQISQDDRDSILDLYGQLYLNKYSMYNPQFTEKMIDLAIEKNLFHFNVIKKEGRTDAVLGYFLRNDIMTTPILGYSMSQPLETGLYRMMVSRLYYIALENGHSLNRSSGAAQFKRFRGADPEIEYSAVYDRHLPWWRRIIWSILKLIVNRIGIPIVKKYKL